MGAEIIEIILAQACRGGSNRSLFDSFEIRLAGSTIVYALIPILVIIETTVSGICAHKNADLKYSLPDRVRLCNKLNFHSSDTLPSIIKNRAKSGLIQQIFPRAFFPVGCFPVTRLFSGEKKSKGCFIAAITSMLVQPSP